MTKFVVKGTEKEPVITVSLEANATGVLLRAVDKTGTEKGLLTLRDDGTIYLHTCAMLVGLQTDREGRVVVKN